MKPTPHKPHVLVAEDNPVNARLAEAMLSAQGCTVDVVENGLEALKKLATTDYDVVFMDMRMPVMDGLEATRQYRAQGGKVPIIAVTANAFDEDRDACLDSGMDAFFTKPTSMADLKDLLDRFTKPATQAKFG